jgi:hypothetical protein
MWHGSQAQPSQGVVSRPHVGTFPKLIFTTCQSESVRGVSNVPACRESLEELERGSSVRIHLGSMEFSEIRFGQVRNLYWNSSNSHREPTLEFLWCIGILAYRDTCDITSQWVIYQS